MADLQIVTIQAPEPTAEETATALAAAAASAPTNEAEARAAIAAAEAAKTTPAPVEAPRPEWLPEKFKSVEDMAAAYSELEKKVGTPEAKVEGAPEADADKKVEPEKKDEEVPGKVNLQALSDEWAEAGTLSDASYADLEAKGYDKATVDQYIAGQTALAELATQRITAAAGDKDTMDRMFAWASTTLTAAEVATFNASFANADVNAAVIAMEQLKGKYEAVNGKDPKLIGGKPPGVNLDAFTSWAEVTTAMSDPRYATDHAYRTKIEQKMARSTIR